MSLDLLLVRHGQTDWNVIRRVMGHNPIALNDVGKKQAGDLKNWLCKMEIDAVYSSPMLRAKETAQILVADRKGLSVIEEPGVAEVHYGDWVGLTFEEVRKQHGKIFSDYHSNASGVQIPGGESVKTAQKRAVDAVERMRATHKGQRVVVVSHADVIKMILLHYLDMPLDHLQALGCDNGSLSIYRFGTEWGDRLVALNYFSEADKILS
ncbi:MAG: histidine phosphatase family protein [Deltaproteobacteria bacterium]|nr:histidine phosphatase family protein [Deltaproteobacteria bacterium]